MADADESSSDETKDEPGLKDSPHLGIGTVVKQFL